MCHLLVTFLWGLGLISSLALVPFATSLEDARDIHFVDEGRVLPALSNAYLRLRVNVTHIDLECQAMREFIVQHADVKAAYRDRWGPPHDQMTPEEKATLLALLDDSCRKLSALPRLPPLTRNQQTRPARLSRLWHFFFHS